MNSVTPVHLMALSATDHAVISTAYATWAGAGASFAVALVAVGLAFWGNAREDRRRRREGEDRARTFRFALEMAVDLYLQLGDEAQALEDAQGRHNVTAMLDSALRAVNFALSISIADIVMLKDALTIQKFLILLIGTAQDYHPERPEIPAYVIRHWSTLARQEFEEARGRLRAASAI